MKKAWIPLVKGFAVFCLGLAPSLLFSEVGSTNPQGASSALSTPDPGALKLQNMLSWLSDKTKIELLERGQKRTFQLALDEFVIETKKELTREEAESLVKMLIPGGKVLNLRVRYILVGMPVELNGTVLADMIRMPKVSSVGELQNIKALCPVLYPENRTDKEGNAILTEKKDSNRRIVTSQVMVQLLSDVSKNSLASVLHTFAGVDLGRNPLAADFQNLDFGSGFQALSATLDMQRDSGMVVHPQIAIQQEKKAVPNDTQFPSQWHINDSSAADVNVQTAWDTVTGTGFSISIVDDGLELGHEDLAANVPALGGDLNSSFHWDFNGDDNNPNPGAGDFHGTACAGLAGAVWNNNQGVVGLAPSSRLLGIRLIAAPSTDAEEAQALGWSRADISSNSWGPPDEDLLLAGPGPLTESAMRSAVMNGRGGKGTIFVFAGGNGDSFDDYSNFDGYAASPYVIAVGATDITGEKTNYSERGSNILISAPGGDGASLITTTDITGADGYNAGNYTNGFNGTSAATPIVAGVVALMLETNPNLTWRDVKEILIKTAKKTDPTDPDWVVNGGGYDFNHKYGAGLVDAKAAVDEAATWVNLQPMSEYSQVKTGVNLNIPDNDLTGVTFDFDPITDSQNFRVETVLVKVDIIHTWRGEITLELTSPSGKKSILTEPRNSDSSNNYFWTFSTVHHWGEDSVGTWKLRVSDNVGIDVGQLRDVTLTFLGVAAPILGPPTLSMEAASYSVGESGGQVTVSVRRTGSLDSEVKVNYTTADVEATDGADYTGVNGTLTFAIGETVKTVTIPILDEDDEELAETFSFTLSNPSGGGPDPEDLAQLGSTVSSIVTIRANDETLVRFQNLNYAWFEGQVVANLVVERTRNLDKWSYVYFRHENGTATAGEDFSVVGQKVLFLPGQSQALIPVQLTSDGVAEGAENFLFHLGSPSGGLDQSVNGGTTDVELND